MNLLPKDYGNISSLPVYKEVVKLYSKLIAEAGLDGIFKGRVSNKLISVKLSKCKELGIEVYPNNNWVNVKCYSKEVIDQLLPENFVNLGYNKSTLPVRLKHNINGKDSAEVYVYGYWVRELTSEQAAEHVERFSNELKRIFEKIKIKRLTKS